MCRNCRITESQVQESLGELMVPVIGMVNVDQIQPDLPYLLGTLTEPSANTVYSAQKTLIGQRWCRRFKPTSQLWEFKLN